MQESLVPQHLSPSRPVTARGKVFRSFREARRFVRRLRFPTQREFLKWTQGNSSRRIPKPDDIPVMPNRTYKNAGWTHWEDFLGTGKTPKHLRPWLPFEEARTFVRGLKLKSQDEWILWAKGKIPGKPPKPENIPAGPDAVYAGKGWAGMGDWLGTGNLPSHGRVYRSFEEAKRFAKKHGIHSCRQWERWAAGKFMGVPKFPADIPRDPKRIYLDQGWTTWGDFLGTGRVSYLKRSFLPFEKARAFVHKLNLKDQPAWRAYCRGEMKAKGKRPDNIPSSPHVSYKNKGWTGYGDWLGNGNISTRKRVYRPFTEARAFVLSLDLKDSGEWDSWCSGKLKGKPKKPEDIPRNPQNVYAEEWNGWRDWIRGSSLAGRWRSFEEAKSVAQQLKFKNRRQWSAWCSGKVKRKHKKPDDIPTSPHEVYADHGWVSWADFLGTENERKTFSGWRSFEKARAYARSLKLKTPKDWFRFCRGEIEGLGELPKDVPRTPVTIYMGEGWSGWNDWLEI